jgi:hypothetical protein
MAEKIPPPANIMNALYSSKTDARLLRLYKVLSTSAGVDSTLTLVGYSLFFVSSQLSTLQSLELKLLDRLFGKNASSVAVKAGTASVVKLADLESSLKILAGMCSDFRTFTRLWGLLGIYALVKKNYFSAPKDPILKAVTWSQTATLALYSVYENGYYLAMKGVLKGWKGQDIKRWAKTSLKMFLAFVALEFVRLFRSRQLLEERKAKAVSTEEKKAIENEEEAFWTATVTNIAYAPLTFHWSSENGQLSDAWVGALMTFIGLVKFRASWALSA